MFRLVRMLILVLFGAMSAMASVAYADDEVVLTVTGPAGDLSFSRDELAALGTETIETTTIWTEGVQSFTGVPLHVLAEALGVREGTLRVHAINDYIADIPLSDAVEGGPLLALLRNGSPMSIRDNGPLWVVYPYDSNPDYQTEVIYSRSVWQAHWIEIIN